MTAAVMFPVFASAQEAGSSKETEKNFLDQWVIDGGATMIPLILMLAAILFLMIFNIMNLNKAKFCPEELRAQLMALMGECRIQSAIQLAAQSPTYLGRLVAYALPNVDATKPEDLGKDAVEDAIADFTANERSQTLKFINMLALCGQVAPMIGLFGTVQGMVGAFGQLASSGQADPKDLAGSISVALLTTFWGLINAIIAIPTFFFQKGIAAAREAECVNTLQEMLNTSINVINAESLIAKIPEGYAAEGEEESYSEQA
ncbi:MAG: MotA/TolQ/ExbB proton channel family protein [Akkermansia sp.]|nr:MotA/TolQ/ExbB proton channel family protein [Akkermansia sp.]